jgi:hypothetical protein
MVKKVVFFISFIILSNLGFGQSLKKFSLISEEYFTQMNEFFGSTGADSKENLNVIKEYKKAWDQGIISESQKSDILNICNALLNKRGKPNPQFLTLINTILAIVNNPKGSSFFDAWKQSVDYLLASKTLLLFDDFNKGTIDLLNENIINRTAASKWMTDDASYTFIFDKEPILKYTNIRLKCIAKNDSIIITNTSGTFTILNSKWTGTDGKVTWRRAGLGENSVYATLKNYKIDMRTAGFKADSVTFINKTYYDKPLFGSLEEKCVADVNSENASYPAFDSYNKLISIKEIYPGVDYQGGFTMKGARFLGSGNKEQDAILYIYRKDSVFLTCRSKIYVFKKDMAVGRNTSVSFKLTTDSMFHPGLLFKYNVRTREVSLIRDNDPQSMSPSPYFNTYHKLDMDYEQLTWPIDKNEIKMGTLKGSIINKATFESANYFRESRYNEIQLNDEVHPLVQLRRYSDKMGGQHSFNVDGFCDFMKRDITQVRQMCLILSYKGFIEYSIETGQIKLKQRLFDYLKARVGKIDYDVINFDSEHDMVGLENASLNINTLDLKLYGVSKIQVSDSQNVAIYPRGKQLIVKKNRNFVYDGIIDAGLFSFFGQDLSFDYENFKIDMKNVDSLKIKVKSFFADEYGQKNMVDIQNVVENITGDLLIDDPHNKSSVKKFPRYPIFNSKQPSFVYYDYARTQQGVYGRDRFYFAIDPYTIDSLNSFTTEALFFDGEFVSAGIFENMREKLMVQKDYSLGFTRYTTPAGYPIYGGKGTFIDTMNLSNRGLLGRGTLNYLNTTTTSREFIFLPDSMNCMATTYEVRKQTKESGGVEYPQVNARNVEAHWDPYKDKFSIKQVDSAIVMYDGQARLQGGTSFTPKGLGGWGQFTFGTGRLNSTNYHFLEHETKADTAKFDVMVVGSKNEFAFKTKNVSAYVNFNDKRATFKSNDKMTVVQFPQNKYICYLNRFSWDMVTEQMDLGGGEADTTKGKNPGSKFISVHPKQDTLNFIAPIAKYDLKKYVISCKGVKFINVADATVYPGEEGKITIQQNAVMETLKNAIIIANTKTKYHKIYDATLDITGRLKYTGTGKYDYINETKLKQTILLNMIKVDSGYQTVATGVITPQDSFKLNTDFKYQGKVEVFGPNPFLRFDGSTIIAHECDGMKRYWFKFESDINPNDMYIPIDSSLKDISNNKLYNSIFMTHDSIHIYSSFISKRKNFNDKPLISASGYLHYDKTLKRYEIGSKEKIRDKTEPGNYMWFHRSYCQLYGEGDIDLGVDLGQLKVRTVGSIMHNIPMDKITLDPILFIDFYFPENLLKLMADTINNYKNLTPVNLTRPIYNVAMSTVLGKPKTKELAAEIQLYGTVKGVPDQFVHTLTISQIDMRWDQNTKSYKSVGKIGIGNIMDKQVNKQVNGYIEIMRRKSGDQMSICLEVSKNTWFYFGYTKEQMLAVSSNPFFNAFLNTLKADKRKQKTERKQAKYEFNLGSPEKKNIFVQNFLDGKVEDEKDSTVSDSTVKDTVAKPNNITPGPQKAPEQNFAPEQTETQPVQTETPKQQTEPTKPTAPVTEPKPAATPTVAPQKAPEKSAEDKQKEADEALKKKQAEDAMKKADQQKKDKELQQQQLRGGKAAEPEKEEEESQ